MEKAEKMFRVKHVSISRSYSSDNVFVAAVSVDSSYGNEIKVKLPEERVLALIEVVSDLIIDSLNEQFSNMKDDALAAIAEREQKLLEVSAE